MAARDSAVKEIPDVQREVHQERRGQDFVDAEFQSHVKIWFSGRRSPVYKNGVCSRVHEPHFADAD